MSDPASHGRRALLAMAAMAIAMLGGIAGLRAARVSTFERGGWVLKDGDI